MLLKNLLLIDGTGAVRPGTDVRVGDGRFTEIGESLPPGADEAVDFEGAPAIPGLIDAHTHLSLNASVDALAVAAAQPHAYQALQTAARAEALLRQGVTTARDVGGVGPDVIFGVRDAIQDGSVRGPRIVAAGRWITATGGHGWPIGVEADGPDAVRRAVREEMKAGADLIKLMASGGVVGPGLGPHAEQFTEEEVRIAAVQAHGAGLTIAAHAHGEGSIRNAVRGGVDTVEHGSYLSEALAQEMVEAGTFLVPTLFVVPNILSHADAAGIQGHMAERAHQVTEAHRRNAAAAVRSGVTLVAGTDMGSPFTGVDAMHDEIAALADVGLSPVEALQAATLSAARALRREDDLGSVRVGRRADLVVLERDPLEELGATRAIRRVMKDGDWVMQNGAG